MALGRAVGDAVLGARADDGYGTSDPFTPAPGPGVWEPTPPAFAPMLEPRFQNVTPWLSPPGSSCQTRRPRSPAGDTPVTTTRSS